MGFWNLLRIGSSALTSQRLRLDLIANNIANAESTKLDENGNPYQRKDVIFQPEGQPVFFPFLLKANQAGGSSEVRPGGVKVEQIFTDTTPGTEVYDPKHPDANEEGFVQYPNVNLVVEMANMISATRSYEANLSMISAAKRMATKALEIGR